MLRPATRSLLLPTRPLLRAAPRPRLLSTAPPHHKSRSWKSSAARWGLAVAGIYYYNTSTVFAEEPALYPPHLASQPEEPLPTLASLLPSSRPKPLSPTFSPAESLSPPIPAEPATTSSPNVDTPPGTPPASDLESEASQQGAFNEETGEINWDCPCLGGMAHGPCGEEFRAAFSCFVYSTEEPKGMDCIERFKGMQECFRAHPEDYPAEMEEEDEEAMEEVGDGEDVTRGGGGLKGRPEGEAGRVVDEKGEVRAKAREEDVSREERGKEEAQARTDRAKAAREQVEKEHEPVSETDSLVPRAAHDATVVEARTPKEEGN
ncbi:Oxidoreductase [Lambiella insularis]|nr:Oxidoreductase [Lambiella insularis]